MAPVAVAAASGLKAQASVAERGDETLVATVTPNGVAINRISLNPVAVQRVSLAPEIGSPMSATVTVNLGIRMRGDLDGDLDVDEFDRSLLSANCCDAAPGIARATYEQGDLDGDGDVDTADLVKLLQLWTGPTQAPAATVLNEADMSKLVAAARRAARDALASATTASRPLNPIERSDAAQKPAILARLRMPIKRHSSAVNRPPKAPAKWAVVDNRHTAPTALFSELAVDTLMANSNDPLVCDDE